MNTATPFLLAAIAAALVASCGGEDPASELIVDRADASMPDADAAVAVPLQDGGIADHASSDSRLNPANGSDAQPDVVDAAIEGAHEDASDGNDAGTPFPTYPPVPYPLENPPSDAKAVLGKILFWDEQLSSDDTVACGTCHRERAHEI